MNLDATFCMESGQVKTGEDKASTYLRMLQEVVRVTPAIAHGVSSKYPSVQALIEGFREEGAMCLEDLPVSPHLSSARHGVRPSAVESC